MRNVIQLCLAAVWHNCLAANNILLMRKQNLSSPYCDRSCVNNGRSLRSPKIFIENKLCDRMIKQLLDEVEQYIEICQ